jgi:rubredoxin
MENFIIFLLIIAIVFIIYRILKGPDKTMLIKCPNCQYEGKGKYITKGSFMLELILWLCFVIPGLIYSVWRLSNKKWICPQCDFQYVKKLGPA